MKINLICKRGEIIYLHEDFILFLIIILEIIIFFIIIINFYLCY